MAEPKTEFKDAFDAGMRQSQPRAVETKDGLTPFIVIPNDSSVEKLESLMPAPNRKRLSPQFEDAESFVRYVNEHKGTNTRIFAAGRTCFLAVIDFHAPGANGQPSWHEHKPTYRLDFSPEWKLWFAENRKWKSQKEFAEFLEEQAMDIKEPDGAELLEIALTINGNKTIEFESGIRLENGDHRLDYKETTTAKAGAKAELEIPGLIIFSIPVYYGGQPVNIQARLRYKIEGGKASFQYQIVKPEKILDIAFKQLSATIAEATKIVPFAGCMG